MSANPEQLITNVSAKEYFSEAVRSAIYSRRAPVSGETAVYLSNLLTGFLNSENLYDATPDGVSLRPLALLYGDAVQATRTEDRIRALQRLGDVALFISGLFADSLSRSLVDVDYYIAMGGNAYSCLADNDRRSNYVKRLREVFAELADRFTECVDVLAEVGSQTCLKNDNDILRLYEIWLGSGSRRALEQLQAMGIQPVSLHRSHH
jgi:hypothetical protein